MIKAPYGALISTFLLYSILVVEVQPEQDDCNRDQQVEP